MSKIEMKANADSWKREPFQEGGELIPFEMEVSKGEMERISYGFIPWDMNQKWFAYYEEPYFFMHRSWTGEPFYRVRFTKAGDGYQVSETKLSRGIDHYGASFLRDCLSNLMESPFPDPDPAMNACIAHSRSLEREDGSPLRFQVMEGDILSAYSDALLVSAYQSTFDPAPGSIFGRIHEKCGMIFGYKLPEGATAIAGRFHEFPVKENRSFNRLFVLEMGEFPEGNEKVAGDILKGFNSLRTSIQQGCFVGLRSLSMPLLGTGRQGLDIKYICKETVDVVRTFRDSTDVQLLRIFVKNEDYHPVLAEALKLLD